MTIDDVVRTLPCEENGDMHPDSFRTERLLGVVVNWPSLGLTDVFARRAGLTAGYRLAGG